MNEAAAGDRDTIGRAFLSDVRQRFESIKTSAERAAAQVNDENFFQPLEKDGNSIALLMKHMGGNLESCFTDFLTTDGEKPTRMTRWMYMTGWIAGNAAERPAVDSGFVLR